MSNANPAPPIRPSGLHHVTAIASDPQHNIDFYLRVLGLRLIKTTVNFDDPGTYHLYYGDESGQPGTLLTFFPWRGLPRGRHGTGQATRTAFSIPENSTGWWQRHLEAAGIEAWAVDDRAHEEVLTVRDPDGLIIDLVAHQQPDPRAPWDNAFVPAEYGIRGLHSTTVSVAQPDATQQLLTDNLGFELTSEHDQRIRFAAADAGPGAFVDVVITPDAPAGLVAGGTVHHIAWRAPDATTQAAWRAELVNRGLQVTSILDRQYFRSIYFREPGGTLFEIATDAPGFTTDEPLLELGRALRLPPWLEPNRSEIEAALPTLNLPDENNPDAAEQPR